MTDSKYFTTTKKGEIFELKSELNNDKKEKKKEAVKKVRTQQKLLLQFGHKLSYTGHRFDDSRQRRVRFVSRCSQLHADWQPRTQEARLPIPDELREISTGYGYYGRKHFR